MGTYIKFEIPQVSNYHTGWLSKLIMNLFYFILPIANPDFEQKIDLVTMWLLEFPDETAFPSREIGIDKETDEVLVKMPYRRNYGYWIDQDMIFDDFKERFNVVPSNKREFELYWESAVLRCPVMFRRASRTPDKKGFVIPPHPRTRIIIYKNKRS